MLRWGLLLTISGALAFGQGPGMGRGPGAGMQRGMPESMQQDMQAFHALFAQHEKITRSVTELPNGVEAVTESDDPKVQALIREHVAAMYQRLEHKQPVRMWDPLFAEIFRNADKIEMKMTNTSKGLKVTETSSDPWVAKLLIAHAHGVSEFVKEGMAAMHKEHPLPAR